MRKGYESAENQIKHIINNIKLYFTDNGNQNTKAIIGISGGKDSTIAAALLVRAIGKERVFGVMMPNAIQKDLDDAKKVCKILDIQNITINISKIAECFYDEGIPQGIRNLITEDKMKSILTNTPARIRMSLLYQIASLVGGRVINTSNFSERYLGYCTKYGDCAGDFSIFGEYLATEVIEIGDSLEEIPYDLVHKKPSDGMQDKNDEDVFGFSYEELDHYIETADTLHLTLDQLKHIKERHIRNNHKFYISRAIPSIFPSTKWNDDKTPF